MFLPPKSGEDYYILYFNPLTITCVLDNLIQPTILKYVQLSKLSTSQTIK